MLNIPNRYGEPDDFIVKGRGFHEQRISIFGGATLQSMYDRKDGCFIVCLIFHEHLRDATKRFRAYWAKARLSNHVLQVSLDEREFLSRRFEFFL